MKKFLIFAGFALAALACVAQETKPHTVVSDLEIQPFSSKVFGNTRNLRVLLPPGYRDEANHGRKYPVMYMQDGQNLFDGATSAFGHEWRVDETLRRLLAEKKIEPMIVVGIDNAQEKRAEEYLPYRDTFSPQVTNPRAADYAKFLLDEVMPYVAQHYRVKGGAENTGLGGSSYGGIVSLYIVMHHSGVFGHALLESMPLHMQDGQLIRDAQATKQWPRKMFIGIGTKETNSPAMAAEHVQWTQKFVDVLHKQGLKKERVKLVVTSGAEHNEQAWALRFPEAMEFLWSK